MAMRRVGGAAAEDFFISLSWVGESGLSVAPAGARVVVVTLTHG